MNLHWINYIYIWYSTFPTIQPPEVMQLQTFTQSSALFQIAFEHSGSPWLAVPLAWFTVYFHWPWWFFSFLFHQFLCYFSLPILFGWLDWLYTSIHPSKIEFKGGQTFIWWPWRVKSHKWSFDRLMRKSTGKHGFRVQHGVSHQPAVLVTYPTTSPFKSPSKLQQLVQSPLF